MSRARAAVANLDWRKLFHRTWPVLVLACILVLLLNQHHAHAAVNQSDCKNYPGLTNRVAACIRLTLQDIAYSYFDGFYNLVKDIITAFVTLSVVIYGVLIAAGMIEKFGRDMVLLAIKISMVFYFTTNVDQLYDWDLSMMDAAGEAVVSFVPQNGAPDGVTDVRRMACLQNMVNEGAKATVGNPIVGPWLSMDCLIDTVIGIKVPVNADGIQPPDINKYTNSHISDTNCGQGMSRGMLNFFFSTAQTSVMGVLISVLGFIFIYSLLFLIIKALFTYLGGYVGITFLMILAPLFIPLVLFRQTKEYFDKWMKLVISFSLQPVVMLVFITMSIVAVDLVMFSGDYSVLYKIAGDETRKDGFCLNKYLDDNHIVYKKDTTLAQVKASHNSTASQQDPNHTDGLFGMLGTSTCKTDGNNQNGNQNTDDPACRHYDMKWWHQAIDWDKLAEARKPPVQKEGDAKTDGEEISREVLAAIIFAGITIFVMNGLLVVVPMIANDLIADFGVSPNLYARMSPLPMQQRAAEMARGFVGRLGSGGR